MHPATVRSWSESTLAERLVHLAQLRNVSQTALGEKAGISKGEMSKLKHRPRPSATKLLAIGSAWGVRLQWLADGTGPIEDVHVENDRYPNRALAASIALEGGIDSAAVRSVVNEPIDLAVDESVLWWIHRIERRAMLISTETSDKRAAS